MTAPRPAVEGWLGSRPGGPPSEPPLPPERHELALGPGVTALVSVPRTGVGPLPLLVFCHGAGGRAVGALGLVEGPAADAGVVVLGTTSAAATWDLIATGLGPDVASLDAALAAVFARIAVSRVALGGFSDGGTQDRVLPVVGCGRRVVRLLERDGYAVTYEEFPGGHVVPPEQVSAALAWWLAE